MTLDASSNANCARKGRILVIRGGAIGDFIVTLPVLAALRERFPGACLEVLAYPNVAPLAVRAGLADEARAIESRPLAGFFARGGRLDPAESERLASSATTSPG
jgi:heptosyltransferase-2